MTTTIHCPFCGTTNDYYARTCTQCSQDISQVVRPPLPNPTQLTPTASTANSFKTSTIIMTVLGAVLLVPPFTLVGIALGVAAYFSYKSPNKNWPF